MLSLADTISAALAIAGAGLSIAQAPWAIVFLPLWLLLAKLVGLYDRDHQAIRHLTVDEVPGIIAWAAGGTAAIALLLPLTPADSLTTAAAARMFLVAALSAFVLRGTVRWLWRRVTPAERTAVIGEGELADAIARKARAVQGHAPEDRGRSQSRARRRVHDRRARGADVPRRPCRGGVRSGRSGPDRSSRRPVPRASGEAERGVAAAGPGASRCCGSPRWPTFPYSITRRGTSRDRR